MPSQVSLNTGGVGCYSWLDFIVIFGLTGAGVLACPCLWVGRRHLERRPFCVLGKVVAGSRRSGGAGAINGDVLRVDVAIVAGGGHAIGRPVRSVWHNQRQV